MKNKILLIDDEAEIRELLTQALTRRGYEIFAASSGTEAKRLICKTVPDLVMSDLQMEDTDGLTLIEELKTLIPNVPVILLTGVIFDPETIREILNRNVLIYLEKTTPLSKIVAEVQRICPLQTAP